MRTTDACASPVSRAICRVNDETVAGPPGLTPNSFTADAFSSVRAIFGLPLPRFRSVLPVSSAVNQARLSSSFS